ncbi:hypothetical protein Egran_01619, partial [Elaphomyces granulatus]
MHNGILAHLQEHWRDRAYLIIDEKSIGLKELHWIDSRLRTIMSKPESEFGGLNVILFGDFYQLPPVCSKPITVVLDQVMRQNGDDEQSRLFRDTLSELRDHGPDGISDNALQFLRSRVNSLLPRQEMHRFDDALHILAKKKHVGEHNMHSLAQMRTPVIRIKARHNVPAAANADEDEAEGLHPQVLLAKKARVMLTTNVATHHGL